MPQRVRAFLSDQSAATAVEYGIAVAGIAIAIASVLMGVGTKLATSLSAVSAQLK